MNCCRTKLRNAHLRAFAIFLLLTTTHAAFAEEKPAASIPQSAAAVTNQRTAVIESFRHDASLADVCFVDPATGWAVGDRGVIWHTPDGGATWRQQSSGVSCRLSSVFFANSRRGWAIGGEHQPFAAASRGVVLRTDDGGNTWTPIPRLIIPSLNRVKFFDTDRGIAVGETASTQQSGVFVTQDGGNTWQPMPTDRAGGWLASDFLDEEAGAVAGSAGRFAILARRQIVTASPDVPSPRALRAMRLIAPAGGWLVGDGGLVLTTKDLGHSWQTPVGELASASGLFDFHALAAFNQHVWIAGVPGTRIFHSPDAGKTWQAFSTNQSAPLRGLTFLDADRGWAVGDFGNILATTDGGRSWKSQRTGGQRVALLGIFANPTDAPLEVLATSGAADGYLTTVDILHSNSTNSEAANDDATDARPREALLLAGASAVNSAWRFPLPSGNLAHSPADLLANLNRESDGRAIEQIEQHLVLSIRMWRPDIIVTHHTKLEKSEPHAAILAALLMQSITAAADPASHQQLTDDVGLQPWQVKKIYGLLPLGSRGAESVTTNHFSPWLGMTLTNFVTPARQLLGPTDTSPPDRYDFELLASTLQDDTGPRGMFNGISLAAGSDARRPQPELPVNDLENLKRMAERRRHLEALLERTEGNAAWAARVGEITEGLNANDGAELLAQLADGYRTAGRLDLAADTYYLLARRYPDHALAARSLEWLIQFYGSSEASHRLASRGSINVRQAGLDFPPLPVGEGRGEGASVQQTAAIAPADSSPTVALSRDDRLHRATQLAEYLRSARPELYAEPRVRFAEVAALRQLGLSNPAKRYYLSLRQLPETNPWRRCGDTETWLAKPANLPPTKALGACRPTNEHPHLDAQLNEPFWQTTDRLRLSAADDRSKDAPGGEVRLAYDKEFLYIAIRCQKFPSPQPLAPSPRPQQPRPRDADLLQNDRVSLRFDVDRDFTTAFELTVDSRGWTRDACWDDSHWNPNWYVAAASDDEAWTVEAAVPLAELVDAPPAARHVWAVSACRTIPRVGYQTWTGEAATDSPDQFGFLIFE